MSDPGATRLEILRRLARRTWVRVAVGSLAVAVVLGLAVVTGFGMSVLVPAALERAVPEGWTVQVGRVDGAWQKAVRIRHLTLEGPGTSASVEEVTIDYRILPLLSRTIDLEAVRVVGPRIWSDPTAPAADPEGERERHPDRGWGRLLSESPLGSWTLDLGHVEVRNAAATLVREQGRYVVTDARWVGRALLAPSGVRLHLDTLVAEVEPPGAWAPADGASEAGRGAVYGRLVARAHLEDGLLDVRTLAFESPRSRVTAGGELLLTAEPSLVERVDFELAADPLDLRDLPVALPAPWIEQPRLTAHVTAEGAPDSMVVRADVDGPGETAAEARGVVRSSAHAPVGASERRGPALELTASLRGDLAPWSLGPLSGDATIELDVRLDSLDARAPVTAAVAIVHRAPADRPGGLLGRDLRVDLDLSRASVAGVATPAAASERERPAGPLRGTATLFSEDAGSGWVPLGTLRATAEGGRADWQVDFQLDSGSIAGRGSARWAGEPPVLVVDRLELEGFDASAIVGTLSPTDVTAMLEGRVEGASARRLAGTVALQVAPSSFGGTLVRSAALRARLEPGRVEGAAMADVAGRAVSSDFALVLGDTLMSAELARLRISTPPDTLVPDTAVVGGAEVEARGGGYATWSLGDSRRGTLSLELDSARVAGVAFAGGVVEGRIVGDSLAAEASLEVRDVLSAPAAIDASLRVTGLEPTEVLGRLELAAVRGASGASTIAPASVGDRLALTVTAEEPGRFVLDGRLLPAEGGGVEVDGWASVAPDSVSFDMIAAGTFRSPTDLFQRATLDTLRIEASGTRSAGAWEALRAELLARSGAWRGVTADTMRIAMRLDSDAFRLDTVAVDSEVLTLDGGGGLPRGRPGTGRIDLRASVQLEPLREAVDGDLPRIGENAFVATIEGATDSLEVNGLLEVAALSYGGVEIADVSAEARVGAESPFEEWLGITTAAVDLELDAIALPETDVQNLTATLAGGPDSLSLEMSARVDGTRTGELVASIDPRPDARSGRLERFHLQLDEDEWELVDAARVSYVDGYALRSFHLTAGEQSIRVDGGVTRGGALDLAVDVDSTRIGTVSDLLGFPRLDGWLGGSVRLEGTVDAPRGVADLSAGFHPEGRPPTTASIRLATEHEGVRTDARLRDPTGGTLTVAGFLPLAGVAHARADAGATDARAVDAAAPRPGQAAGAAAMEGGLALEVAADAFDVSSAVAFVAPELLATLEGRIDARLGVAGSPDAPTFAGPIELMGGRAQLPELGVTWEEMTLHAHGDGARLVVDSARVRAGPGDLRMRGAASVADTVVSLDLAATLDEFQAIQNEEYRAVVSGDLSLGGTHRQPVVEGDIQVVSLDVYLGESASTANVIDVELTEEDLETLRERFGYVPGAPDEDVPLTDFLTADLTVELSRDSWLRKRTAPEMAVAFSGEVEVQLRPQAEPRVQGSITTIADRGYVQQFGKRFELREGTVTLDGPADSARVDLAATYTIPSHSNPDNAEATIVLRVEGTQDDLVLTLSSEPPMENADIVSYVATGRPAASNLALGDGGADGAADDGQGGLQEAGAGIALDQIVGAVERAAQEGIGLDVVEIRREGIRGATLAAGKYLSPSLYVGFAQPVTHLEGDGLSLGREAETEVEIEYELLQGLLLNVEGSNSGLHIFLRGRVAY